MILFLRAYGLILIAVSLIAIMGLSYPGNAADIPSNVQWYLLAIIAAGLSIGAILATSTEVKK